MPVLTSPESVAETALMSLGRAPLLGSTASGAMLALGVALMLVILLRRSGRYVHKLKRRAKKAGKPGARPSRTETQRANMFDRASPLLDAPATVARWQVEMEELARDLKAEIDTKLCLLQVLVRRSNEAAERLEAAALRAEQLGCRAASPDEMPATIENRLARAAASGNVTSSPPIPPCSAEVYALADAGGKAADIADRIGLPIGDVEFLLSLRSQSGDSA